MEAIVALAARADWGLLRDLAVKQEERAVYVRARRLSQEVAPDVPDLQVRGKVGSLGLEVLRPWPRALPDRPVTMLEQDELTQVARAFGVSPTQVRRDHLISHLLHSLAESPSRETVGFYGGTALARTYLPGVRMSEDIDLWASDPRRILAELATDIPRRVRREYPDLQASQVGRSELLTRSLDGSQVRIHVMEPPREFLDCIRSTPTDVMLRYSDLPESAELPVPTIDGFVVAKHLAWADRSAPVDLVDLDGLAQRSAFSLHGNKVVSCIRGFGVIEQELARVPDRTLRAWHADLAHQMASVPEPHRSLQTVRNAWAVVLEWH